MNRAPYRQFALQAAAVFLVLSFAWPYYALQGQLIPWEKISLAIGGAALLLSSLSRQPWWWRVMHGLFMPLAWIVSAQNIDPGWFLFAFFVLLLVYRGALSGQVPLYFSNRQSVNALAELLAERPGTRFLDLGAGIGSTTIPLADHFPEGQFTGVENAPLTWLVGRILAMGRPNIRWCWADLWQTSLAEHDVVYAFLSPAPMAELWAKVEREMPSGSLFISNTFPVPDVEPTRIITVDCTPARPLYLYQR